MNEVSIEYVQLAMQATQAAATLLVAVLVYRFTARNARNTFESQLRDAFQSLNLDAIEGKPIRQFLIEHDKSAYDLNEKEESQIYYVYFEMNMLSTIYSAYKSGIIGKQFLVESVDERLQRLAPYKPLFDKMVNAGISYTPDFLKFIRQRLVSAEKSYLARTTS